MILLINQFLSYPHLHLFTLCWQVISRVFSVNCKINNRKCFTVTKLTRLQQQYRIMSHLAAWVFGKSTFLTREKFHEEQIRLQAQQGKDYTSLEHCADCAAHLYTCTCMDGVNKWAHSKNPAFLRMGNRLWKAANMWSSNARLSAHLVEKFVKDDNQADSVVNYFIFGNIWRCYGMHYYRL